MAVGGEVSGEPDELEVLAGLCRDQAVLLTRAAREVLAAVQHLVSTRSEGLGWLGGNGSNAVASHATALSGLGERARRQAADFRSADAGAVPAAPVRCTAWVYGPPRPGRTAPRPGNWAGIDARLITAGAALAKTLRGKFENSDLTDDEVAVLAAWRWNANQRDDQQAIRQVIGGLSVRDLERVRRTLALFDWSAYGNARRLVPSQLESVMEFFATDAARKLPDGAFAAAVKRLLSVDDPVVVDAVRTYLRYEIGTARHSADAERERYGELIWGWNLPGLAPRWWSGQLALDSYGMRADRPDSVDDTVGVVVGLLQGHALVHDDRELVAIRAPVERGGIAYALAGGVVVGALVAAALPEAAMAGSIAAGLELLGLSEATAGLAGGVIATAMTGAMSGVASGISARAIEAMLGEREWSEVVAPDATARDAVLGGLMNLADYSLVRTIGGVSAKIAAAKAAGKSTAELQNDLEILQRGLAATEAEYEVLSASWQPTGVAPGSSVPVDCPS